ncbi:MAG: hypothetical protein LBT55_08060 [Clostridiaceae bacterium]|jgi:hypothetical protein|nr:hypothetical protein [Clostridiaceae bacterium]
MLTYRSRESREPERVSDYSKESVRTDYVREPVAGNKNSARELWERLSYSNNAREKEPFATAQDTGYGAGLGGYAAGRADTGYGRAPQKRTRFSGAESRKFADAEPARTADAGYYRPESSRTADAAYYREPLGFERAESLGFERELGAERGYGEGDYQARDYGKYEEYSPSELSIKPRGEDANPRFDEPTKNIRRASSKEERGKMSVQSIVVLAVYIVIAISVLILIIAGADFISRGNREAIDPSTQVTQADNSWEHIPALTSPYQYEEETNWFDEFCDGVSSLFD